MFEYPNLFENPANPIFNFEEAEIYSIKEAIELIEINHNEYSLFAIWNTIIINIQRRIEFFGLENFLNILDKKEHYNKNANTLKERWLSVNEFNTIEYAKKLNIINHISHNLITMSYWMKSNITSEDKNNVTKKEILSLVYLLEKNLFLKEFKQDKRIINKEKTAVSNPNRRKEDLDNNIHLANNNSELILQSSVKVFEKQNNKQIDQKHLIDKYI